MRIAVLTTSYPATEEDPSGHFVRTEVRKLEQEGHTVTVVAPEPGGAFGWPGALVRVRRNPLRVLSAARWCHAATSRLRAAKDLDLVMAHWALPCGWPIGTDWARTAGPSARLNVVSHGSDVRVLLALPASLRNRIAGAIADAATEWRFVSAPLRDALLQSLPPDLARRVRAHVAASPIELPDIRDDARHLRETLGANGTIAVTVGRLVPEKQVDRVLEHAARIGPKLLVVVGDGPERARLERLARGVGVNARFVGLVGRREALAWIGAADVLWHASRAEGLSTVVREAAALGIPVEWV